MSKKLNKFSLENKLKSLKQKEFIYLLVTIPILFFVPYYNFIYPQMVEQKHKLIKKKKKTLSSLSNTISEIRKLKKSKISIVPVSKKLETLKEDYKYIKYDYGTLTLLQLDNQRIYNITTAILKESKKYKMGLSIKFEWDNKPPKPFTRAINVEMNGRGRYLDIVNLIKYIESINSILEIKDVFIKKSDIKHNNIKRKKDGKLDIRLNNTVKDIAKNMFIKKSSISFLLNNYDNDTLLLLKEMAKSKKLELSISQYRDTDNILSISFKGDYEVLKELLKELKNSKIFSISNIRTHFIIPHKKNQNQKFQSFTIKFNIVGVK